LYDPQQLTQGKCSFSGQNIKKRLRLVTNYHNTKLKTGKS